MNFKKDFLNEVNKIKSSKLKKAAKEMVKDAPEYFWHVAASSSGKYHPQCDLGEGGLVRHSIMVAIAAVDFVSSEIFVEDTESNRDMAIVAGLFHDVIKHGKVNKDGSYSNNTVFSHPILSSEFVKQHLEDAKVNEEEIKIITGAILSHMGKWNTSKYEPGVTLNVPSTAFQKLIHSADYMASRKYVGGLDDWGYIFTNTKSTISDEEKEVIKKAIDKHNISKKAKEELGITRSNEEIVDIWNNILNSTEISERQKKYYILATKSI